MGDSSNIRKKNPTPTLSKSGWERGAGDRTRTGTLSPAVDFESTTSTNSITPACDHDSIHHLPENSKRKL